VESEIAIAALPQTFTLPLSDRDDEMRRPHP